MSDLLITLNIVSSLAVADYSAAELCEAYAISVPSLKRRIADARQMGADITSVKIGASWYYRLANWDSCKKRVMRWSELEENRTFI